MPRFRHQAADCDDGSRLTSEEAAELSTQLAELAKSGLPLAPGLRALATELPSRRVAHMLRQIAAQLDAGVSLPAALETQGRRFPVHLRGLILAGVASGRLADTFEEFVAIQHNRIEMRRRLWMILAYPLVLLAMIGGLWALFGVVLVPQMANVYATFGVELPAATMLLINAASPMSMAGLFVLACAMIAIGMIVAALRTRMAWAQDLCYCVPVLGPLWRWSGLAEFSRLMGLLLEQQVPLPKSLRLAAEGVSDPYLAIGCRRLADMVEKGGNLSDSLAHVRQFPASLRPVVRWGQETPALPEAFRAAADMFTGRVQVQSSLLEIILLPLILIAVLASVSFLIAALMVPLTTLIRMLS